MGTKLLSVRNTCQYTLGVIRESKEIIYGSTKPSESPTKLFLGQQNHQKVQDNYSFCQQPHRRIKKKLSGGQQTTGESNKTFMWVLKTMGESN